jgi:alpha-galactosidase
MEILLGSHVVFSAEASGLGGKTLREVANVTLVDSPAEAVPLGYPHGPKTGDWVPEGTKKTTLEIRFSVKTIDLHGMVAGSGEEMPCSDNPNSPMISSVGGAASGLENAVYDRTGDWLLAGDAAAQVARTPEGYRLEVRGSKAQIAFKPDYYRNHLGYFLWDNKRPLWPSPIAGWCSWAAYGQDVNEENVVKAADFFSRNLKSYGYDVIQIDDGFQRVLQFPTEHDKVDEPFSDYWTKPNSKFPSGMDGLAKEIGSRGLIPGVWLGIYLPLGLKHEDAYVTDKDGKPHKGPWVGYSMDPYDDAAVAEAYTAALKEFKRQGWRYFKVDTLRHMLYDSYRQTPDFWAARHTDSSHAFRTLFTKIRQALGPTDYLLACWGTLPEIAGLPDGCRIGEDVGPDLSSLQKVVKYNTQFHYLNNVVWRNDPDYMCFRLPIENCQTWATLNAFAGGQMMVSDPIETYERERLDILRQVGPPLMVKPGNVTALGPYQEWFVMPVSKAGEDWTVVARLWPGDQSTNSMMPEEVRTLASLGLEEGKKYLAYDFWNSRPLGIVDGSIKFHFLSRGQCQVIAFRPLRDVPQVYGDDRHIGQGVHELQSVVWGNGRLAGRFRSGPGRVWHLYLHVPAAWRFETANVPAKELSNDVVELSFEGDGWKNWQAKFLPRK